LFAGSARGARAAADDSLRPVLGASEGWLNGPAAPKDVAGKVVVVDVFTFGCGNCQNVVPNLRSLNARHNDGLVIIGVHSPETPYEHSRANVVESLRSQGISWPVAIDNSFSIWKAYGVDAWPTQMIFDRHGRLRKTIVGDSQDRDVDAAIDALLAEK
jgi:thiol-disulfide isomerase/thioredoxin